MTTSSDRIGSREPALSSKTQTDCKSTTPSIASFETDQTPWAEAPRAEAKTRLAQYVAEKPEGVPLPIVVTDVFNVESVEAEMADYQLTRRFFIRRDEFRIDRREDFLWVEPTPTLFTCSANKHCPKPPDAKRNAQRALDRRQTIDDDVTQGYLLGALAAKRDATENRFVAFEDREAPENYLLVPYATRFNSPSRVHEAREGTV